MDGHYSAFHGSDTIDGWEKVTNLGNGGFGIVDLWKKGDEEIALKQIRASEDVKHKVMERWKKEIDIMKRLSHNNVIAAKEIPEPLKILNQKLPILAMEYCSKGDLRKVINKTCKGLKETEVLQFSKDVSSAVEYLHSQRIVHRDLKPENIVLKEVNGKIIYKLIDLGYAKELGQDSICNSFVGTLQYLAPELFLHQEYTHTVDYWSFGTVIFEIITGFRPFLPNMLPVKWFTLLENKNNDYISAYQENDEIKFSKEFPVHIRLCDPLKQAFQQWLKTMLTWDPKIRGYDHREKGKKENCFTHLEKILEMKILSFYHVMENTMLHYPLAQGHTFEDVQNLVFARTKIPIKEQEIFLFDGKEPKNEPAEKILTENCNGGDTYPLFLFQKKNIPAKENRTIHFRVLPPKVQYLLSNDLHHFTIKAIWEEAVYHCDQILFDCDNLMNCHKACWSAMMRCQQEFSEAYDNLSCLIQSLTATVKFFLMSLQHNTKKYEDQAQAGISSNGLIQSWYEKEKEAKSIQISIQECKNLLETKNIDTKKVSPFFVIKKYDNLKQEVNAAKNLYINKDNKDSVEDRQKNMKRIFLNCIKYQEEIFSDVHDQIIKLRQKRLDLLVDIDTTKQHISNLQKYSSDIAALQKNVQLNIWKLIEVVISKTPSINSKTNSDSDDTKFFNSTESLQIMEDNSNTKNDHQKLFEELDFIINSS